MPDAAHARWVDVLERDALDEKGRAVVKVGRKQIAFFAENGQVFACNNRCPHEGYPLSEGKLSGQVLTCNWHNWKFDLRNGCTLIGGDRLRTYPVREEDGRILVDVSDPPAGEQSAAALSGLHDSFRRHEYGRMAREIARLEKAGCEPEDAVRAAIRWTADRFEFGTTHAHAAAADWLHLRDRMRKRGRGTAESLVPVVEIVGHLAWDSLREPAYPFPEGQESYDEEAFVAAIEDEDEERALALARGALAAGAGFAGLERGLARAALQHYQDFGHSLIYVLKTGELIARLGEEVAEPLVALLVRSLVYAMREDLIPEFRCYGEALAAWDGKGSKALNPKDLRGLGTRAALNRILESSGQAPEAIYRSLLGTGAWSLQRFDMGVEERSDNSVADNAGWLDLTHTLTFSNAVRRLATCHPELWPAGLLQIGCFLGRNAGYIDRGLDVSLWRVEGGAGRFFAEWDDRLIDHGAPEYIVSAHYIKVLSAAAVEVDAISGGDVAEELTTAVNRFLLSPVKRKHSLRTARQALGFVVQEG